jgi:hypothetical protein
MKKLRRSKLMTKRKEMGREDGREGIEKDKKVPFSYFFFRLTCIVLKINPPIKKRSLSFKG